MDDQTVTPRAFPARVRMSWEDLAFFHWRLPADSLRSRVPDWLEIDEFDGSAWLGVVPFRMARSRFWGGPEIPGVASFLEINLRTYVKMGSLRGVWFFSLDAGSRLATFGGRTFFALPYFNARMRGRFEEWTTFQSARTDRRGGIGEFDVAYRPSGPIAPSVEGSFESWATDRFRFFTQDSRGRRYRCEIDHDPWPLQPCDYTIRTNSMGSLVERVLDTRPDNALFSKRVDVVGSSLFRIRDSDLDRPS